MACLTKASASVEEVIAAEFGDVLLKHRAEFEAHLRSWMTEYEQGLKTWLVCRLCDAPEQRTRRQEDAVTSSPGAHSEPQGDIMTSPSGARSGPQSDMTSFEAADPSSQSMTPSGQAADAPLAAATLTENAVAVELKQVVPRMGPPPSHMSSHLRDLEFDEEEPTVTVKHRSSSNLTNATAVMILLSAIEVAVEVEYCADNKVDSPVAFHYAGVVFNTFFLLELLARMFIERGSFFQKKDRYWNVFDIFIVLISWIDIGFGLASNTSSADSVLTVVRIARMLRVLRMLRVARVIRKSPFFEQLRLLLSAIASAWGALGWSLFILFSINFIAACFLTQASTDYALAHGTDTTRWQCEKLDFFFGSLGSSWVTLFLSATGGMDWADPLWCIYVVGPLYAVVFALTASLCIIAILNIVNGFFVESAMQAAKADREYKLKEKLKDKEQYMSEARSLFHAIDPDGSSKVSMEMFKDCVSDPRFAAYLDSFDLDLEDGMEIIEVLDVNGDGLVSMDEFVKGCMCLRGPATAADIAIVRRDLHRTLTALDELSMRFDGVSGTTIPRTGVPLGGLVWARAPRPTARGS